MSAVAPWALSYLLFLSRLLANCDICSKMKAEAKSECQYPRCGRTKCTNGGVSVTVRQSSFKWKVAAPRVCWRNDHFLSDSRGHICHKLSNAAVRSQEEQVTDQYKSFRPTPCWQNRPKCEQPTRELNMTPVRLSSGCKDDKVKRFTGGMWMLIHSSCYVGGCACKMRKSYSPSWLWD